jgi:hypothetical protein
MQSKFALVLLCCAFAGSHSAQAAPVKQQQLNLYSNQGADYFPFPEGAQVQVTQLVCPPGVTVSVTCRTASRGKCGNWYLGPNGTATAGSQGKTGIASLAYSGNENCSATIVVKRP